RRTRTRGARARRGTWAWLPLARLFCFRGPGPPRHLHSFPTRRSSDLPSPSVRRRRPPCEKPHPPSRPPPRKRRARRKSRSSDTRSEEHTSELQSLAYLVCRLLLEKKNGSDHTCRPPRTPGTWS